MKGGDTALLQIEKEKEENDKLLLQEKKFNSECANSYKMAQIYLDEWEDISELEGLVLSTFLMYAGVVRPEYFSQLIEHLEGSIMKYAADPRA